MSKFSTKKVQVEDDPSLDPTDPADADDIAEAILSAADLDRDFTWVDVDGIRRVSIIVFSSAQVDAELGQTATLTRNFTYMNVDPFDLTEVKDTLAVV